MRRTRGFRCKTRHKLQGGRFSIAEALQTFATGEKVWIHLNPSVHSGMPHPRYHGRLATVLGARGRAFYIGVQDGGTVKKFYAMPEHLNLQNPEAKPGETKADVAAKSAAPKAAKAAKPAAKPAAAKAVATQEVKKAAKPRAKKQE